MSSLNQWEIEVKEYLSSKGCKYLSVEEGYVFFENSNGKIIGMPEENMAKEMS